MNVPFLHRKTLDLQRIDECVEWTCLTTFLGRITQRETGKLSVEEAVHGGSTEQVASGQPWDVAARFIKQKKWQNAQVVVRLNSVFVRHCILQGPVVETVEDFDHWLLIEVAAQLPAGANIKDFVFRSRVLHQGDDTMHCLVGLVHRTRLKAELMALHAVDVFPVKISGVLVDSDPLIRDRVMDAGYGVIEEELAFNFLADEHICTRVRSGEKKLAVQTILAAGGVFAVLLSLILVFQGLVTHHLEAAEEQLMLMGTQRGVLDHQQKTVENLTLKLEQARRFMGERTAVAGILTALGKCVPANVWLDELVVFEDKDGQWNIQLQGVTLDEQGVTLLLSRLEKLEQVTEVELVLSEVVQGSRLYKKDKLRDIPVTRFDITVKLPGGIVRLQEHNVEAS